jgi:hypothetical protein
LKGGLAVMGDVIAETGMDFVSDNTFHIEKSRLYSSICEDVRTVELVRVIDDKLLFVEAKTTFPNPNNPSKENLERFHKLITEVYEKFLHSLNLLSFIKLGVVEEKLPVDFILPEKVSLMFLFVIKDHKSKWCKRIKQTLIAALPPYPKKIWEPEVFVINHETATKRNITIVQPNGN